MPRPEFGFSCIRHYKTPYTNKKITKVKSLPSEYGATEPTKEAILLSPEQKYLMVRRYYWSELLIWDIKKWKKIKDIHTPPKRAFFIIVEFSPDKEFTFLVARKSEDVETMLGDIIMVYETKTWEKVGYLNIYEGIVDPPSFTPDGKLMALGYNNGTIRIIEWKKYITQKEPE